MIVTPVGRPRPRRCAPSCSPPSAPPGSAAPRLRRLIVHDERLRRSCVARLTDAYGSRADRRPAGGRHAGRPADRRRGVRGHAAAPRPRRGRRRHGPRRRARAGRRWPDAFYVQPGHRRDAGADRRSCAQETFAPILYVLTLRRARRGDRPAQRRAAGPVLLHLHHRPARGRAVPVRRRLATAASPTSTSARAAPRSAARSAARRRPAAAASRAPTRGRPTCAAPPTRSTTRARCRWRRASRSMSAEHADPPSPTRSTRWGSSSSRCGGWATGWSISCSTTSSTRPSVRPC